MKKRAKKNTKKVKDRDLIFYVLNIFFVFITLYILNFIALPQPSSLPFFVEYSHNKLSNEQKLDLKKILTKGFVFNSDNQNIIFHGDRTKKMVALTFDADMTEGMVEMLKSGSVQSFYDGRLIQSLRESQTPATLFLAGKWTEVYPDETRNLASDPLFELGSHSYAHKSFTNSCYSLEPIASDEKIQDIGTSQFMIEKYTGVKTKLFRFPGGCYSEDDLKLLKEAGMTAIQWDVVGGDGFNPNPEVILSNIVNKTQNGSIIVLHMNGFPNEPYDYFVVPQAVKILKEKGFEFVTVSQLLTQESIMKQ
jgi:peptidoglycan/xylan/chitin deacetylase (PgdA/CDA1 family)